MKATRSFASDNDAGVHPAVLQAIEAVNGGHAPAYGHDDYTASVLERFRAEFGPQVETCFVFAGTAANVLTLAALTRPYQAVLCAASAHINTDECGAAEHYAGCKLLPIAAPAGKLAPELLEQNLRGVGDEHSVQPRVVSVTQATERGTLYTPDEIRAIASWAHAHDMVLQMDGARLANAAAALDLPLRALAGEVGVDALSFGGTKNGLMFGEAIVFFRPELARDLKYIRKQGMQLYSKMRFVAAQFDALLTGELWRRNAAHANAMARRLAAGLERIEQIHLTQEVQANAIFACLPPAAIARIQERYNFYVWDESTYEVRWMTAWDTTEQEVDAFLEAIGAAVTG